MKNIILFSLIFLLCITVISYSQEEKTPPIVKVASDLQLEQHTYEPDKTKYELIPKWQTEEKLLISESIMYDTEREVIYVSCINGRATEKNGQGFISKINLDGKIETLEWVTGINAPKGMGIYNNKLYVTDIDELIEVDLETGKIINKYPIEGAIFLNDIAIGGNGNIYISDMKADIIYKFNDGKIEEWAKGEEIKSPNGLYMEPDKLIFGNSGDGKIKSVNLLDKKIEVIAEVSRGIDGLKSDGKGNWITSDWYGNTSLIKSDGKIISLLNTTEESINSADLEYIIEKNLLLIPTFYGNNVSAYTLKSE